MAMLFKAEEVEQRFSRIEADLLVIKRMMEGLFAVVGGIGLSGVWLAVRIAAKVGALS